MNPLAAAILGLVEGLTEYLPVSSTGHLILAGALLDLPAEASKSFEIVIQLGAILAVVLHYRTLLADRAVGLLRGKREAVALASALLIAFLPAALLGFAFHRAIKSLLFYPKPVSAALLVGGVVMIVVERVRARKMAVGLVGLEHVGPWRALAIGVGQCVSLWPGSSRSMCTIVAGQVTGLSTTTAAEFSFLLALPTLGAATLYELWKSWHELLAAGVVELAIGLSVSFLVAWAVIAGFLRYLQHRGLSPFGWYRIVVGGVVFWVMTR